MAGLITCFCCSRKRSLNWSPAHFLCRFVLHVCREELTRCLGMVTCWGSMQMKHCITKYAHCNRKMYIESRPSPARPVPLPSEEGWPEEQRRVAPAPRMLHIVPGAVRAHLRAAWLRFRRTSRRSQLGLLAREAALPHVRNAQGADGVFELCSG